MADKAQQKKPYVQAKALVHTIANGIKAIIGDDSQAK